mgnify:CR=1 FL=1
MKKKILIIGSTGYIGSKLKKILSKKYKLITPNKKKLDITNYSNLKKFVNNNIHYIINLSGQISNNSNLMKRVIINGNKNIIKLCCDKKIKIFFLSTSLIYGYSKKNKNENSIKKPIDNYSKFKLIAEKEYFKSSTNFIILRLCNIYNDKKNGIVKNLKSSVIKKKKLFITNSMAFRNYINVKDLVTIITKMLNTKLKYKVYNVGYENVKLIDLINKLEKKFKLQISYFDRKIKLDTIPSQKISCSRVYNEINYRPKIKIKNYLIKNL